MDHTRQETRRYAKRQLTWFRSLPDIIWIEGEEDFERMFAIASWRIREWLSTGALPTIRQPE